MVVVMMVAPLRLNTGKVVLHRVLGALNQTLISRL
jgi:hypothetical protein